MIITASKIASTLGLTLIGGDAELTDVTSLDEPKETSLGFLKRPPINDAYQKFGALITTKEIAASLKFANPIIISPAPYPDFVKAIELFYPKPKSSPQIHPTAIIDPTSELDSSVSIGAYVVIGAHCKIGKNVSIHPHVVLYDRVTIGDGTTIHAHVVLREKITLGKSVVVQAGSIIGADGFGYIPDQEHGLKAVPQIGTVVLDDHVEVGANACIDRATLGSTSIGRGTKIDNLVQIGHNVSIGSFSILCGQVGVGGSSKIGNQVVLGGQSGVADHMTIEDSIRVAAQAGVTTKLTEAGDYIGFPAIRAGTWRRQQVFLRKLKK